MPVETEIKLRLADVQEFRAGLALLMPRLVAERHFEDNFVLDYPDGRLRNRACLLRVRKTKIAETITFKGPPQPSRLFKSREELETRIENADLLLKILNRIGMEIWFRYQKFREEYSIEVCREPLQEVQLALDWTPIGQFAELEGSEPAIRDVAARLGFAESLFLRESYYQLFVDSCRERGMKLAEMVFAEGGNAVQ